MEQIYFWSIESGYPPEAHVYYEDITSGKPADCALGIGIRGEHALAVVLPPGHYKIVECGSDMIPLAPSDQQQNDSDNDSNVDSDPRFHEE